MKVRNIGLGIVVASFVLASAPALAQDPRGGGSPGGSADRGGGGGPAGGGAGAASGGGVVTGDGGGGGGFSGGGGSSSSGGGFSSPSMPTSGNLSSIDRGSRATAPERRSGFSSSSSNSSEQDTQKASPRTAAGPSSGDRAVPRGTASGGSSSGDSASAGSARTRNPGGNNASGTREVPEWSRPRGDRPATGVAVDRVGPPPDRDRDNRGRRGTGYYYDPYYYGGGYGYGYGSCYSCGYGFSPYYYPYGFGMGYGLYSGLGWNPYYGDPMDSYYGGAGGYSSGLYNTRDQGNLKLKVKPRAAKVYVDGYFVGTVDQFDGAFQKLALNGGRHKVEIRADGFETAEFDVLITPSQTITFQGELKRIQ